MDDASLSTFVTKAMSAKLPSGFHDDITQRLIYSAKWNDKPEVVPASKAEAAAKKQDAVVLYRTVNYNPKLKMLSSKVADSLRTDDAFSTGGWSGQYYGGGVYFSDKLSGSKYYGNVRNGNAPTITEQPTGAVPTVLPSIPSSSRHSATRRLTMPCVQPGQ